MFDIRGILRNLRDALRRRLIMRALTGELLLAAWDEGTDQHPLTRGLILLSLALPESNRKQLAELTIAERNVLLLRLRELSFGGTLQGFCTCSRCCAHLEFALPVAALIEHLKSQLSSDLVAWSENGRQYQLRPVTTDDLLAALDVPSTAEAQDLLLNRCLTVSRESSEPEGLSACEDPSDAISPATVPALVAKFDQLHAAAELGCAVQCAGCSNSELLDLDIAQFLWLEVRSAAKGLLAEIHELAWAYGWSENSILRMSPRRRNAYMEMLSA
jgi:hypothetical protein